MPTQSKTSTHRHSIQDSNGKEQTKLETKNSPDIQLLSSCNDLLTQINDLVDENDLKLQENENYLVSIESRRQSRKSISGSRNNSLGELGLGRKGINLLKSPNPTSSEHTPLANISNTNITNDSPLPNISTNLEL